MRLCYLLLITAFFSCSKDAVHEEQAETEPAVLAPNSVGINEVIAGYYSALPARYNQTSVNYPLLISLHGAGQIGNGSSQLPRVLTEGIPFLLDQKTFPPSFRVNDTSYSFIILAPQFKQQPKEDQINSFIDYASKHYRIDTSRIYITGLSEGSVEACDVAAAYPRRFAAIVPVAGESKSGDVAAKCKSIADGELPVWVLHNNGDQMIDISIARNFVSLLNSFHPKIAPQFTELLPYGLENHDAWTHVTDPSYRVNGKNIYEWMLQYKR